MYKYIVFDFDGTLVDSRSVFLTVYNDIAAKHGYNAMTPENLEHMRSLSVSERCKYLKVPMYRIPFIVPVFLKSYTGLVHTLQFNPGMKEVLERLSDNDMPFALLSSNSKENISAFFGHQGIAVDDIYTSGKVFGKDKAIKKLLRDKKLKASEILYVGDEAQDIIACKKTGIKIAWVSWGYDSLTAVESYGPDHIIDDPSELLDVILKQN
jgi:phosphoglycolate phosphatase